MAPAPSPHLSPNPSPEVSGSGGPGFGSAVAYTPYNADQSCKSTSQVAADFQKISGYEVVRLYGTDCNQVGNVIAATHGSVKLLLGIFDINSIQSEVQTIASVWHTFVLFHPTLPKSRDVDRQSKILASLLNCSRGLSFSLTSDMIESADSQNFQQAVHGDWSLVNSVRCARRIFTL